jgi:cell division protease FtsH
VRAGRLDRVLELALPDRHLLARILLAHMPSLTTQEAARVALHGAGSTGADVESWARGARRHARAAGRPVTVYDVLVEVRGPDRTRTPSALRRAAVHESGHAVVALLRSPDAVEYVSLRGRTGMAGSTAVHVSAGEGTLRDVEIMLVELMSGRAAEEVVIGAPCGGSGGPVDSDLGTATVIATAVEASWGLGDTLTWLGESTGSRVSRLLADHPGVADAVESRLQHALDCARDLVVRHRAAVEAVADALIEHDVLSGEDVREIVASARPSVTVRGWQLV